MVRSSIIFLFFLSSFALQAQEQDAAKDSLILRRFFHAIGRGFKKTNQCAKNVAYNAGLKYHDSPNKHDAIDKRFTISLNAGINYLADFGPKHFSLDTSEQTRELYVSVGIAPIHTSYVFIPELGFHGGIVVAFRITKSLSTEGGLIYFSKRSEFNFSTDTNEINAVGSFYYDDSYKENYFKKLKRNDQSIQIPFYFCYSHKRVSILAGTKVILVSIIKGKKTLLDDTRKTAQIVEQPFSRGSRAYIYSIPSIKVRYQLIRNKIPLSLYVAADWLGNKKWDWQAGLQAGIFSK